jgi:hypothetical protein
MMGRDGNGVSEPASTPSPCSRHVRSLMEGYGWNRGLDVTVAVPDGETGDFLT